MSQDTFVDVTRTTGCAHVAGAGCAMLIGIVLVPISFVLLFWNEGRAIRTDRGLREGSSSVISVSDPSQVNPANDGKLVHITGRADTSETLTDPTFAVSEQAIRLERQVAMYQWTQKE